MDDDASAHPLFSGGWGPSAIGTYLPAGCASAVRVAYNCRGNPEYIYQSGNIHLRPKAYAVEQRPCHLMEAYWYADCGGPLKGKWKWTDSDGCWWWCDFVRSGTPP